MGFGWTSYVLWILELTLETNLENIVAGPLKMPTHAERAHNRIRPFKATQEEILGGIQIETSLATLNLICGLSKFNQLVLQLVHPWQTKNPSISATFPHASVYPDIIS